MKSLKRLLLAGVFAGCGGVACVAPHASAATQAPMATATVDTVQPITANVNITHKDDMDAANSPDNWLLNGRTYSNQRFSPLKQITSKNVSKLQPVAIIQTGVVGSTEGNPIVANGIMYVTTAWDHVEAYDAASGKEMWSYNPHLGYTQLCCGPENRGIGLADGRVYVALLDGNLTALDAKTGKVEWTKVIGDSRDAFSLTLEPQVYDGMVIIGTSGAEFPTRNFVAAYDGKTGKEIWRFYTVPSPDQPGGNTWSGDSWKTGGGSMWNTPAIDPKLGLAIFATGNPNPDNYGGSRKGANAYTDSIVAVHIKTGKIAWWYQQVPHDVWDYDADAPVVLLDVKGPDGKMVPAAAEAGKEGNVFIVNRENGHLIRKSAAFVMQSKNMFTKPSATKGGYVNVYPGAQGGNEWSPEAYSPDTHLFYVDGTNESWEYSAISPEMTVAGHLRLGGVLQPITPNGPFELGEPGAGKYKAHTDGAIDPSGNLSAVDPNTGKIVWQDKFSDPMVGGVMTTAGNLVFAGEMTGDFDAFDAKTGKKLWHFGLGSGVNAPPISYSVNGKQYIAVEAGGNSANGNPVLMQKQGLNFGDTVAIFALN